MPIRVGMKRYWWLFSADINDLRSYFWSFFFRKFDTLQLKTDCGTLRCGWKRSNLQCEGWSKKYSLIRHTKKKFILSVRNGCGVFLFVKVLKFNLSDAYWYNMILTHFSILKDLKNYEIWLTPILNCHFDLNTAIFRKASIFLQSQHSSFMIKIFAGPNYNCLPIFPHFRNWKR